MTAPRNRKFLAVRTILLATLFALLPRMEADAAGMRVDLLPSARIQEGWESNVSNSSTGKVSSLATRVTPGLALKFTTADSVEMKFSGNYEKIWYHNSDVDRSNNDTFHFRVDSTGELRLTPTLSMVPSVYYINTTSSSRRTQLVPSEDPTLPPMSITNYGNTKSEDIGGGVRFNYQATRNVTMGVDGSYSRRRFDFPFDNAAQTGLKDSSTMGAGASVSYRFSPRTRLGVRVAGNRYESEDNPDSNAVSGHIILVHLFSPTVQLDGSFGGAHVRRNGAPGTPAKSSSAPSGTFNLSYRQTTSTTTFFGSAVYSGGSGYGEGTRQFTAGLRFMDRLARDWSWSLSGTYQVSQSVFSENGIDIHTINGATGFQYQPWRWATLDLTGNLSRQRSSGRFGESLNNYSAYLGFTAAHPYNLF